ncbi:MAG: hypothetical protein MUP41_02400 [Desulfobacterales bacterium]|nr:hypothetical protein [Desulfobacterales bacterium]
MLKQAEIRDFLVDFKGIMAKGRGLDIVNRLENIDTLAKMGLTKKNLIEEIMTLSVENYCQGPEPDRDRSGAIWVFGKQIGAEEIYVKLKIAQVGKEKIAKCLSFHAANFPLCYPYRGEERRDEK